MFTEEEFIIYVYCLVDDYLPKVCPAPLRQAGFLPKFSDAEALPLEIVGESLGLETDKQIVRYFRKHDRTWFKRLPDRTTLVRQWQHLWQVNVALWQRIVYDSGAWRDPLQLIDTVPLPICHPHRAPGRHVFQDDLLYQPSYGYCAAKDWHDFGFKGGVRRSSQGMILAAPILPASPHDLELLDARLVGIPQWTWVFGDKGFLDLEEQTALKADGVWLKTPLRRNMAARPEFQLRTEDNRLRRLIETVIGQLTDRFHIQALRVRKGWTLAAKWYRKILPHTICVCTNLKYGLPPTQLETLVHD
jgi:hypothetical protein